MFMLYVEFETSQSTPLLTATITQLTPITTQKDISGYNSHLHSCHLKQTPPQQDTTVTSTVAISSKHHLNTSTTTHKYA